MHESPVHLPQELTDLIIDSIPEIWDPRVNQARLQRLPSFSTLALVCHSFRNRANKHRFAHVTLHISADSAEYDSRLSVLDRLISQEIWPQDLAITHHVRGLHLFFFLDPESGYISPKLRTWLNNGIATKMLRRVFCRKSEKFATAADYALSLDACPYVGWENLPASLTDAIQEVCRTPNLTSLCLKGFRNLPQTIVSNGNVKSLMWSKSVFDLARPKLLDSDTQKSGQPGNVEAQTSLSQLFANLETLDVDESSLSSLIAESVTQQSGMTCASLKVLKVETCTSNQAEDLAGIIRQATAMETLQLRLNASGYYPPWHTLERATSIFAALRGSAHFTTLSIHYSLLDMISRLQRSVGVRVANLLKVVTVHAQLRNLDIVVLFSHPRRDIMSVAGVLRGHGCIELMDLLAKNEFGPQLRSVKILFVVRGPVSPFREMEEDESAQERHKVEKDAERYLRSYFADLAELRPEIDFDISMDNERGLRYSSLRLGEYMFI